MFIERRKAYKIISKELSNSSNLYSQILNVFQKFEVYDEVLFNDQLYESDEDFSNNVIPSIHEKLVKSIDTYASASGYIKVENYNIYSIEIELENDEFKYRFYNDPIYINAGTYYMIVRGDNSTTTYDYDFSLMYTTED